MVSFRIIITSALALAAPIAAQASTAQVVDGIKSLTAKAEALRGPAQSISLVNSPLIVIGQGPFPTIIQGYVDIVRTTATLITQAKTITPPPTDADSATILTTYRDFACVNQEVLNILIGKAGLLDTVLFIGQPIAALLRQVEGAYDSLAFQLIETVPLRASDLRAPTQSLASTLDITIQKYSGIQSLKKSSLRYGRREVIAEA